VSDREPKQHCPKCQAELLHVERSGMVLELCSACRGIWFDPGELTTILELYKRLDPEAGVSTGAKCVRSGQELREVVFPGTDVRVDVCPDCQGIWLDAGELEVLQQNVAAIVPQAAGTLEERARELLSQAERAEEQRFSCPKCKAKLWHLQREGNVVEVCSDCEGIWFDASELTVLLGVYRRLETTAGEASGVSCLRCGAELLTVPFPGSEVQIDACPECRGIFLDRGEFSQLKAHVAHLVESDSEQMDLNDRADLILDELDTASQERARCPKCQGRWESAFQGSVRIERCNGCHGTWLDSGDLTRVLGVSRRIRAKTHGEFTELPCIRCPDQELIEVPYPRTEVPIDICPDCRGVFLDEGELAKLVSAVRG
jgi:Zn-finger nucleic acid-binding protein